MCLANRCYPLNGLRLELGSCDCSGGVTIGAKLNCVLGALAPKRGTVAVLSLAMAAAWAFASRRFRSMRSRMHRVEMVPMMAARITARMMVTTAPEVVRPFCSTMHRWLPAVSVVQYSPSTHTDVVVATREQSYVLVASHDVTDVSFSVEQTRDVVVVPVPVVVVALSVVAVAVVSVLVAVVSVVSAVEVAVVSVVSVVLVVSEVAAPVAVEPSVVVVSRLLGRPSMASRRWKSADSETGRCLPQTPRSPEVSFPSSWHTPST